jgi:caspase domain-containing protein
MKYALIIGNNQYNDPKLAQLKTPEADARALAKVLRAKYIGDFEEVTSLVNQTEARSRRAISAFLSNKKPDDLVLLYFSGHGVLDARGSLFLALKDTQIGSLNATAISSSFITYELDNCRSRQQILILDCCNSGAFARGTKGQQKAVTHSTFEGSGSGRVVLTASDTTQFAFEGDQVIRQTDLSLFTHFLLEGLKTGEADTNNDGKVSLDEWYDYSYAKITATTPQQIPYKWSYKQRGDLIIARNPFVKKVGPTSGPARRPKSLQLRAMLDQKQLDYERHKLLLEPRELELMAEELESTKLDLEEADKRLFLLSAVTHGNWSHWLALSGAKGLEWLRQAYQDSNSPQELRLGAVRRLGEMEDAKTYRHLLEVIGQNARPASRDGWLDLLAQYQYRNPHPRHLLWQLNRAVFPRLARLIIKEGAAERARISYGVAFLAPICVAILFGFSWADPTAGSNDIIDDIFTAVIFSIVGVVIGVVFAQVITSLVLLQRSSPRPWQTFILFASGYLLGIPMFSTLTGSTELWLVGAGIGTLLAGIHLAAVLRPNRYLIVLSPMIAVGTALSVFFMSVSETLLSKLGESVSAGLFAAGYVYLVTTARRGRSAHYN